MYQSPMGTPLPPVYTIDSFMVKDFRCGIYQLISKTKDLQTGIYQLRFSKAKDLRVGIYQLRYRRSFRVNGRLSSEKLNRTIEFFKISPPAKQSQTDGRAAVCFCFYYIVSVKQLGRKTRVSD